MARAPRTRDTDSPRIRPESPRIRDAEPAVSSNFVIGGVIVALLLIGIVFYAMNNGASMQTSSSMPDPNTNPPPVSQNQAQPQGPTGPITTGERGGAPASSPQGETPPGMQSAPQGSSGKVAPKQPGSN